MGMGQGSGPGSSPIERVRPDWADKREDLSMAEKGTVARVTELPMCDFCKMNGDPTVPAQYDAVTNLGPWASMCMTHYTLYGPGRLGTGLGQRYEVVAAS